MINVQANLTFLGTEHKDFNFTDKTTNNKIEGTSHKIKFMDLKDNAIYIFKLREDDNELNNLELFKNYLVHFTIFATVKENIINFDRIEQAIFDKK